MKKISYGGYRFPPEIIQQAIWLYLRFTLSLRDVEDLLAERGIVLHRVASSLDCRAAQQLPPRKRRGRTAKIPPLPMALTMGRILERLPPLYARQAGECDVRASRASIGATLESILGRSRPWFSLADAWRA
jgi:hypothetical protein